jgi:hypothetical protein
VWKIHGATLSFHFFKDNHSSHAQLFTKPVAGKLGYETEGR